VSAQRLASASDLTDAEWQILEPLLPAETLGGRPRKDAMREGINGIPYVWRSGRAWRLMPHDLPQPSAAIIEAQTVKTTEKGSLMGMMASKTQWPQAPSPC
jgi:transposase